MLQRACSLSLKWANSLVPNLVYLEKQYDISRRILQRTRAKLSKLGVIERMEVLRKANSRGFYTCCSFYPLFHGIADLPEQIDELIRFADEIRALEIVVEPIDHRNPLLVSSMRALMDKGFEAEAAFIGRIQQINNRSRYVVSLISNIRRSLKMYFNKRKDLFWWVLYILLWRSGITASDIDLIEKDDEKKNNIIWLHEPPVYFSGWLNYSWF